ncbi:MAG: AAA family ATPase [Thermoplasmataceae archaeon]
MSAKILSFEVENFKSFERSDIVLSPLNVIVGPNGSGKTNLMESVKLAFDCVNYRGPTDYPFVPFWGYNNAVYRSESGRNIYFKFEFQASEFKLFYEQRVSGEGGSLRFLEEKVLVQDYLELRREGSRLSIRYSPEFFKVISSDVTLIKFILNNRNIRVHEETSRKIKTTFEPTQTYDGLDESRSILSVDIFSSYFNMEARKERSYDLFDIRPNLGTDRFGYTEGIPVVLPIHRENLNKKTQKSVPLFAVYDFFRNDQINLGSRFRFGMSPIRKKALLLRHNFIYEMKKPVPLNYNSEGAVNGEWAVAWLFKKFNEEGKFSERIQRAMEDMFPGWKLGFKLTDEGNIILKVNDESISGTSLEFYAPSLPDGFFKVLLVLIALEAKPSVLMIDELENSLHDTMIQYLLDSIRESGVNTIVSTHSPLVINSTNLEELRILENAANHSTVRSVKDTNSTKKKLVELGITPSESWLYGELV